MIKPSTKLLFLAKVCAVNGKTEWQQQFANPAEMIYKAVDLNNKIHSTKDSIIARLRKALEVSKKVVWHYALEPITHYANF